MARELEETLVASHLFERLDMETPNWRDHPFWADTLALLKSQQVMNIDDRHGLAQAIVDTIREPLLVLDRDLRVVSANRSFYLTFGMNRQDVQGRPVYALGDGQWNIDVVRDPCSKGADPRKLF